MYILIILINIIILFSGYIVYRKKLYQKINIESKKYIEKNKQILEAAAVKEIANLEQRKQQIENALNWTANEYARANRQFCETNQQLHELSTILNTQRESAKTYEETLREQAREASANYEMDLRKIADTKVCEYEKEKYKAADLAFAQKMAELGAQSEAARARLEQLEQQIKEYGAKQTAINEAIMREREVEEQKNFYRVCIDDASASDISLLQETRKNLKKQEIIDKIIYDNYIAKPVLEMIKRVLQNESFSGIYKITNILSNEIYIGKSTDIKSRWQQHCKTAFNCGTIATSLLHTKMKQYGIENFTFEVVEKVPKDQLSEREKFYIDFYQTKEYGMNERKGG